ncbi:MAG: SDR family NAD(P)-dependent oxidoreductase, partial [Bdellovibrionota bacterium]
MSHSIQQLFDLEGKVAVVTGGAGFLGTRHAAALAEAGANVVLWDFSAAKLKEALAAFEKSHPGKVTGVEVNISEEASVAKAASQLSRLDILVNNAGMTVAQGEEKFKRYFDKFENYPLELWEMALKVNLTGTVIVTQKLASLLLKSGAASVINIASDVGVISPDHRIYEPNPEHGYEGVHF